MKAEDRKLFKAVGLPEQSCEEEIIVMQAECKHVIYSDRLINYERYGTYSRLLRVVCYVSRFVKNLRARKKPSLAGELSATETASSGVTHSQGYSTWYCD